MFQLSFNSFLYTRVVYAFSSFLPNGQKLYFFGLNLLLTARTHATGPANAQINPWESQQLWIE